MRTALLCLAGAGLLTAVYAFLEAKLLFVRRIPVKDAPLSLRGRKAVVFSDMHMGVFVSPARLARCMRKINAQKADYIFFAGDFANNSRVRYHADARRCAGILSQMQAKQGKFAVYGNHDASGEFARAFFDDSMREGGFRVLKNECAMLTADAALLGLEENENGRPDLTAALRGCPPDAYKIVLVHQPDLIDTFAGRDVRLQLSGHSHGTQIYLPWLSRKMLPEDAKKYYRGSHRVESAMLHISNGVGLHSLPFRFLAPPDILVLEFE